MNDWMRKISAAVDQHGGVLNKHAAILSELRQIFWIQIALDVMLTIALVLIYRKLERKEKL